MIAEDQGCEAARTTLAGIYIVKAKAGPDNVRTGFELKIKINYCPQAS
jgi:hypothetical protein